MKLIVGLGNPGGEYERTRHNVGFRIVERLARDTDARPFDLRGSSAVTMTEMAGEAVLLVKPLTYMNRSGDALAAILDELEDEPDLSALMIVTDDVALPAGRVRFRAGGSCGGHNGLASIEAVLASRDYPRLRVGVGPEDDEAVAGEALADYVLGAFTPGEEDTLEEVIPAMSGALVRWVDEGLEACQQAYNGMRYGAAARQQADTERPDAKAADGETETEE